MGKAKLRRMLARDGMALFVPAVGRIPSRAIADGRIKPASLCEGAPQAQAPPPERFLEAALEAMPFPFASIQVDGGSGVHAP